MENTSHPFMPMAMVFRTFDFRTSRYRSTVLGATALWVLSPNCVAQSISASPQGLNPAATQTTDCHALPDALDQLKAKDSSDNVVRMNRALFDAHQGKRIANIEVTVNDIFDLANPDENKRLFRVANRLQINTQKSLIKSQLLFKAGEKLNPQKVNESLRILFSRHYLLQAQAIITHSCDDQVSLRVIVRDAWGIKPKISFSQKGGEDRSTIGLRDTNFLGTGYRIAFEHESTPNGNELSYLVRTDNFLRKNYQLEMSHTELSKGQSGRFLLQKPFIGLNSEWAYGVESTHTNQEQIIRWQDQIIDRYDYERHFHQFFLGKTLAQSGLNAWRVRAGIADHREQLSNTLNFDYQYLWFGLEKTTSHYRQYNNLHYIQQVDDVPVESEFTLTFGAGQDAEGDAIYLARTQWRKPLITTPSHLWQVTWANQWRTIQPQDQWTLRLDSHYFAEIDDHQRWVVKANYQQNHLPQPHNQLVIGELSGLRGYPNNFQRGAKRALVSVERRYYSNWHPWNIMRMGFVAFWDTGRVWGDRMDLMHNGVSAHSSSLLEPTPNALTDDFLNDDATHNNHYQALNSGKILSSLGLGMRLHSSKSGTPTVVHFNIGFPLVKEQGANLGSYTFSASGETRF